MAAFGRAEVHAAQSLPGQALDDCDYLLGIAETDWQRVAAQLGRAGALRQLHRTAEADAAFQAARAIDPHAVEVP